MRKFLTIFMGLVIIAIGVYCLFTPISTFLTTGYVLGVVIFCDAIGNIIAWTNAKKHAELSGWYLVDAIISLIFGIVLIVSLRMQFAVDMFIVYLVAIWVTILGISRISLSMKLKKFQDILPKIFKNKKWVAVLCMGILMILFGILCMVKPIIMSSVLGTMIALAIIFAGATLTTLGTYMYE